MRALSVVLLGALVAAGCSSGDDDAAPTTAAPTTEASPATTASPESTTVAATTTSAPTTTVAPTTTQAPAPTTTTEAPAPATTTEAPAPTTTITPPLDPSDPFFDDKQLAQTALLRLEDFGEGWSIAPPPEDREENELDEALDICLAPDDPDAGDVVEGREVESGEFAPVGASFPQVNQEVGLAEDEAAAISAMARIAPDNALACYRALIGDVLADAFQADDPAAPTVDVLDVTVDFVDLQLPLDIGVAYSVVLDISVDGAEATFYLDIRFLRQGRALSQLQFEGFGEQVRLGGQDTVTNLVLSRMAEIGGS